MHPTTHGLDTDQQLSLGSRNLKPLRGAAGEENSIGSTTTAKRGISSPSGKILGDHVQEHRNSA